MGKDYLKYLRSKFSNNEWISKNEANNEIIKRFILQCLLKCGKTLLSIYGTLELIRAIKGKRVPNVLFIVQQCVRNTLFLVYVFQSAIIGPNAMDTF